MNNLSGFYDNLDLKYPEIAIAMDDIDRINPGEIRFIIPVLTPNMDNTRLIESTVYQNRSNLMNNNSVKLEISNVKMKNYVSIRMPKEVCGIYGNIEGDRIIRKGSKWMVSFVGGDITKPRIIARYYDN